MLTSILSTGFTEEHINYFRVIHIVVEVVLQGLRTIFKQEWDKRYKTSLGEWEDTPKNGLDFYHRESPRNQRRYARMLATMMNGNRESWDILMLIYAILHSDSIGSGLSEPVRSSVDELRKIRNEISHNAAGLLTDPEYNHVLKKVKIAFQALGLSTQPIENNIKRTFSPIEARIVSNTMETEANRQSEGRTNFGLFIERVHFSTSVYHCLKREFPFFFVFFFVTVNLRDA